MRLFLCASLLTLTSCTLIADPEPPTIPAPVPVSAEAVFTPPYCPLDRVEVALLPRQSEERVIPARVPKKATKAQTPVQLVSQAQKAARIEPSEQGYAGSAEMVYPWVPGKVYTVYLTKKHATGIFLPPGERLVIGLYLDEDAYEVKTKRAGTETGAYDAVTIRPLTDSGEVEGFLLTDSGRRYLLHLAVGSVGMLAVTFEGPVVSQARSPEPALILPRPPQ